MVDLLGMLEAWLTYINVQVLGLKPFHLNLVKTPLLLLGTGTLLWTMLAKSSAARIARFTEWCLGLSCWRLIVTVSALLAGILSYLSLKQYYVFTAEAYDLAIFTNSMWHFIDGAGLFDSLQNRHFLGDHFVPILIVFAQLYRLWESPVWLLMAQVIALVLGGIGLGLVTYRLTGSTVSVMVSLLLYVSNPYLHSVAALDFHPIALAIPVFIWVLYCLDTERYWTALALACAALLVEESLPPGLVGVGLYLFFFSSQYRRTGIMLAVISSLWFLLEVTVLLPHFSEGALVHWDRYTNLGPNFHSALYNLITNPLFLVNEALAQNHKFYYVTALLLSVGFLPLFAWRQATLIVLPALVMLLSGNGGHYKFGFHYSAAILPFLFYSMAHGIATVRTAISARFPMWARSNRLLFAAVVTLLILNVYQIRGYRLNHVDPAHVEAIHTVLSFLPPEASVRADGNMLAVLSGRHRIAPIDDAVEGNFNWWVPEYFVVDFEQVGDNPIHLTARQALNAYLRQGDRYRLLFEKDGVALFKLMSSR